ncbi:hypothetical protein C672_1733 [[Clostridium] bifermentans ATCC 638]|uniref:Uncharacterized protein n=1 Tax=Paraclostridium bifermentans ATCC 638 = DSM 14991 TaxID=1233171 RepID=T4VGE6_PARBF|nr:hypothetical protein [Paraclostridium bifermentans]EQK42789.1 hypothetical protein C672_1733 [[Clostridium] bifermentans ATCC 638] [Paraclostridium bifermentans ATCC 638 = DSM 14991]RIZ58465.1 hypothetical protein CHH45_11620 [Paraclostridium bifermentans]UAG19585.1 hypothetical protein KXZ80_07715 [Paraclostridium bifermentans]
MSADISSFIQRETQKVEFAINTKKEGILEFAIFNYWRYELLLKNHKDIENLDNVYFAKELMKFLLYKYKEIIINSNTYKDDKSIFNNIDLEVSKQEIIEFADEFLAHNDYLLYKPHTQKLTDDDFDNLEELQGQDKKNREPYFEFPSDSLEKLKQAFTLYSDRQRKRFQALIGLNIPKTSPAMLDLLNQRKTIENIFKSKPNISAKPVQLEPLTSKNDVHLNYNDILNKQVDHKAEVDSSIILSCELIERISEQQNKIGNDIDFQLNKLIELEKAISDNNNKQLKLSNTILQDQLNITQAQLTATQAQLTATKESIKSSDLKSNGAMVISILSLLLSLFIGIYQIFDSNKTSSENFKKYDMINNSIIEGNKTDKYNSETTNKLIDELREENKSLKEVINKLDS